MPTHQNSRFYRRNFANIFEPLHILLMGNKSTIPTEVLAANLPKTIDHATENMKTDLGSDSMFKNVAPGHMVRGNSTDPFKQRLILYHGWNIPVTRLSDLPLSDEQIRDKWDNEESEFVQNTHKRVELLNRLRGLGIGLEQRIDSLRPFEEFGSESPYTPAFVQWLIGDKKLCSDGERQLVEKNLKKTREVRGRIAEFGVDRIDETLARLKAEHDAHHVSGKKEVNPLPSREQLIERFSHSRQAFWTHIENLESECRPIFKKMAAGIVAIADVKADEIQGEELDLHEKHDARFGWGYVPSKTVIMLRQLSWRFAELQRGNFDHQALIWFDLK